MLGKKLEQILNDIFKRARSERVKYMTVDHLALGVLEAPHLASSFSELEIPAKEMCDQLRSYLAEDSDRLEETSNEDTQPTSGFQQVLQRAVFQVQISGQKAVSSGDILIALLTEEDTFAGKLFANEGVTKETLEQLPSEQLDRKTPIAEPVLSISARNAKPKSREIVELQLKLDTAIDALKSLEAKVDSIVEKLNKLS